MAGVRFVVLVVVVSLLAACGKPVPQPSPSPSGSAWPTGHSFTSTAVTESGSERPLVTAVMVSFRDPGEVLVRAGCNELTVTGALQADRIVPKNLAATEKGCAPDLLAQDAWIKQFFEGGPTWRLAGVQLTLTSGNSVIRLSDDSDRPLLGTRWVVVSRSSAGTTTSVPAGVAYVIFTRTGMAGETGCSGLGATTTVHDGVISIDPVHRSDIPCGGVVSELDAAVMGTLQGEVHYRIKGTELVLSGSDGSSLTLKADDDAAAPGAPPITVASTPMSMMDGPAG